MSTMGQIRPHQHHASSLPSGRTRPMSFNTTMENKLNIWCMNQWWEARVEIFHVERYKWYNFNFLVHVYLIFNRAGVIKFFDVKRWLQRQWMKEICCTEHFKWRCTHAQGHAWDAKQIASVYPNLYEKSLSLHWRHNDHDGVSNHQPHGCLLVYSGVDQRKHQSSASLAFVRGIHWDRWIPRTNGQWRGKCFHLMKSSCAEKLFPCV